MRMVFCIVRAFVAQRILATAMVVGVAFGLSACADVPKEAVTLSVTIGNDLEEVHRSHRELAVRYFKRSRDDVNRFVDEVYGPAFVQKALTEKTYDYEEGKPEMTFLPILRAEIERLNAGEDGADPLFYMQFIVEEAVRTIEQTRVEMMAPINSREQEVLRAIDDAYSKVQNAQAFVTGHLASVRRVQQAQEDLLADAGLKDIRQKFIDKTADISDRASEILANARRASASVDEPDGKLREIRQIWEEKTK